ncbi:MAG: hypothetical protein RIC14_10020 [Filomicrobium sp.]
MSAVSSMRPAELAVIGINIDKDVFHIIGFDPAGTIFYGARSSDRH